MAMVVMEAALNVGRLDSSEVPHLRERKKAYLQHDPFKIATSLSLSLSLSSVSICCVSRFSKALNFFSDIFFFHFLLLLSLQLMAA